MVHLRSLFQKAQMNQVESNCRKAFDTYGLSSILWNVTYECGLKCKHCYVGETKKTENELNSVQAQSLISNIGDMGIPLLFMTGGEPLMRKDTFNLLTSCKDYGITTVLSSNGLLIDTEKARQLKKNNVHFLAVSVYGPPAKHDEIVGIEGSYNKLMKNVEECIKEEINICFKTVVSSYTYDNIPYIVDKGIELGVKSFYFCDLLETGRAKSAHLGMSQNLTDSSKSNHKGIFSSANRGPRIISWNTTLSCNLKCDHCYINANHTEDKKELNTIEGKMLIDQIAELGRSILVLSGGEPLLRKDIFELASYGVKKNLIMTMGTNGTLIDNAIAKKLFDTGIRKVAISIDSSTPKVHDKFRGVKGAWNKAIEGVNSCNRNGVGRFILPARVALEFKFCFS